MGGGGQRQRGVNAAAIANQMRDAAQRAIAFGINVDVSQRGRAGLEHGQRRRHRHGRQRARALVTHAEARRQHTAFAGRAQRQRGIICRGQMKSGRLHHVAGFAAGARERFVIFGLACGRRKQEVEGDGFGAGAVQAAHDVGVHVPRQRPVVGARNRSVIGDQQRDIGRRIARATQHKRRVHGAAFQPVQHTQSSSADCQQCAHNAQQQALHHARSRLKPSQAKHKKTQRAIRRRAAKSTVTKAFLSTHLKRSKKPGETAFRRY